MDNKKFGSMLDTQRGPSRNSPVYSFTNHIVENMEFECIRITVTIWNNNLYDHIVSKPGMWKKCVSISNYLNYTACNNLKTIQQYIFIIIYKYCTTHTNENVNCYV